MYARNLLDLRLSAYLYEATNHNTYYNPAILSHEFMQSHPCKGDLGCFLGKSGSFDVRDYARVGGQSSLNVAIYLEGLSVLANKTGNFTLYDL